MKTVFALMILGCSVSAVASSCPESYREFRAITAATQVELINMGEPALTREVIPMNSQDFYLIRFSYSGVQHSWRVYIDDISCHVKAVMR